MIGDLTFLKGNIVPIILNAIYDKPDKQDYSNSIWQTVASKVDGYEIKKSTIYAQLTKLESLGLIDVMWGDAPHGGRRKYFKLTAEGENQFLEYLAQWNKQKQALDALVDSKPDEDSLDDVVIDSKIILGSQPKKRTKKTTTAVTSEDHDAIAEQLAQLKNNSTNEITSNVVEEVDQVETDYVDDITYATENITDYNNITTYDICDDNGNNTTELEHSNNNATNPSLENNSPTTPADAEGFMSRWMSNLDETMNEEKTKPQEDKSDIRKLYKLLENEYDTSDKYNSKLEQAAKENETIAAPPSQSTPIVHMRLDAVAERLSKRGITLRLYNKTTSTYKARVTIPTAKLLITSGWVGYLITALIMGILVGFTHSLNTLGPVAIMTAVLLIMPIAITIYAKTKPASRIINCRLLFFISLLSWIAIALLIFSVNALFLSIKMSDTLAVILQVVSPILLLTMPMISTATLSILQAKYKTN